MSFPKAPKKPVVGTLKLSIRNLEVEGSTEDDPNEKFKSTPDLSNGLKFSLPRGFMLDTDREQVIGRQKASGLKRLSEIRDKAQKCRACHRRVDLSAVDRCEELLEFVASFLKSHTTDTPSFVVSQEPDGSLSLDVTLSKKLLCFQINSGAIEIGHYSGNSLVEEKSARLISSQVTDSLSWLVGNS